MGDLQLYLAIGVPVVVNGIVISIAIQVLGQRITSIESAVNSRFASLETRFELLQGATPFSIWISDSRFSKTDASNRQFFKLASQ